MNPPLKARFHLREKFQDSLLYFPEMFKILLQSFVSLFSPFDWNFINSLGIFDFGDLIVIFAPFPLLFYSAPLWLL